MQRKSVVSIVVAQVDVFVLDLLIAPRGEIPPPWVVVLDLFIALHGDISLPPPAPFPKTVLPVILV